jgi:hypothetical protein
MSKDITLEEWDTEIDVLYSYVDKFVNDDSEDFSTQIINLGNIAHMKGWHDAIAMVLDVVGSMYNGYDNPTLEELRQRIV